MGPREGFVAQQRGAGDGGVEPQSVVHGLLSLYVRSDRIGSDRIGSDRIGSDRIGQALRAAASA